MDTETKPNGRESEGTGLHRRRFLQQATTAGLSAAILPTTFGVGRAQTSEIIVASWGGNYLEAQKTAFFDDFEKETGNRIVIAEWDLSKLQLMVESGNIEWDLITGIQGEQASVAQSKNLLEPIDFAVVPKGNLIEGAATDFYVAAEWYSAVIAWDAREFEQGPQGWSDFWDVEKFPGPRALGREAMITLLGALLADGVEPSALLPIDYDRAFRSLDRIKPHVGVWYTSNGQPPQLLIDGQVVMSTSYNARIQGEMNKGAPLAYTWDQNLVNTGGYAVPRGAKNPEGAMQLIAWTLDPERQARFAEMIPYGVTTKEAFSYLDQTVAKTLPTAPGNIEKAIPLDVKWIGENFDEMTRRLDEYILK